MQRSLPASPSECDPEKIRVIVSRTRAEQDLPPTIADPVVLRRLATLLAPKA